MRQHDRHEGQPNAPTQRRDAGGSLEDCDAALSSFSFSAYSPNVANEPRAKVGDLCEWARSARRPDSLVRYQLACSR